MLTWPAASSNILVGAIAALVAGASLAAILIPIASARIGRLAARPAKLLLEVPEVDASQLLADSHWATGTALSWAEAEEDVEALRRYIGRASRRAEEVRTALEQADKAADVQDQEKSEFMSKIGHELRTPLNTILGYATLLHEDAVEAGSDARAADLQRILTAGRHLLMVISDMLGWAKLETRNASVERHAVHIRSLAQSVVSGEFRDARADVEVDVAIDARIDIMMGDGEKLKQCLLNLVATAAQSTADGKVTLAINACEQGGVPAVIFAVGVVAYADQAESGLSLAVAKRLAQLMGGDCIVENHEDGGRTWQLVLPLSASNPEWPQVAPQPEAADDQTHHVVRPHKCALIIDDDEAAIDLMGRWLREMGYTVLAALDGEMGLQLARDHRPDFILLDCFLPGRSGYEILKELRADPLIGGTPVIIVTVDDDRPRGIASGASDYLRKPVNHDSLKSVLDVYSSDSAGEILIIDDDDDAAELIRRSAEEVGFSTRRASNGIEGLLMARKVRPAAIVLDIRMPLMDGFGVIEQLAGAGGLSDVPLVVLSGQDMAISEHRLLAATAKRVFKKGIATPREIAQSLQELVA